MSTQPKKAEMLIEINGRVAKCSKLELEKIMLVLAIIEANRRMHYLDVLADADRMMWERWLLMRATLNAHDEDVHLMRIWCEAIERQRLDGQKCS